jgi:hypothetical protein
MKAAIMIWSARIEQFAHLPAVSRNSERSIVRPDRPKAVMQRDVSAAASLEADEGQSLHRPHCRRLGVAPQPKWAASSSIAPNY